MLEVPDVICQEYPITSLGRSQIYSPESSIGRVPPSVLNFLPKPPPIPPPPERYYTSSEICNSLPAPPSPPPLSPPSVGITRSKINRHFMLPLSPELDDRSDHDEHIEIESFPREQLRIIEKLGDGQFGEVHLCELRSSTAANASSVGKLVIVHTLMVETYKENFNKEVHALSRLKDPNIARLLGACLDSEPICAVRDYSEMGDLCQFLQDHVAETATPLTSTANTLR